MTTLPEKPLSSPEIQAGIQKIHASLDQAEIDLATATDEQTPFEQKIEILQRYSNLMQETRIGWRDVPEETIYMLINNVLANDPDWEDVWQRDNAVSRKWLNLFETGLNTDVADYQKWVRLRLSALEEPDEIRAEEV